MADLFISVDDGHEDQDSGAVGNGAREVDITVKVGTYCRAELVRNGVKVLDPSGSLSNRIQQMNNSKVTANVSIHCNAFNAKDGDGTEILVYGTNGTSYKLAQTVYNDVVPALNNGRGIKVRTDLGVLKRTVCPSILIELAFIDNKDYAAIDTEAELKAWGVTIARAICKHYGVAVKNDTNTVTNGTSCDSVHRVIVDGKQVGAYKNHDSVANAVKANAGASKIEINKI